MMRVFDFAAMERMLTDLPAVALRDLASAIDAGYCKVRFRASTAIGGSPHSSYDTVRLTLDVDVRLVDVRTVSDPPESQEDVVRMLQVNAAETVAESDRRLFAATEALRDILALPRNTPCSYERSYCLARSIARDGLTKAEKGMREKTADGDSRV